MKTLAERINKLSGNLLIEAAHFFSRAIAGRKKPGPAEREALALLQGNAFEYMEELEELSRIVLLKAVQFPAYRQPLEKALAGVGQKSFVSGGAETIYLAGVALVGLQTIIANEKSEETETYASVSPDGKLFKTSETTTFTISPRLGVMLRQYFSKR